MVVNILQGCESSDFNLISGFECIEKHNLFRHFRLFKTFCDLFLLTQTLLHPWYCVSLQFKDPVGKLLIELWQIAAQNFQIYFLSFNLPIVKLCNDLLISHQRSYNYDDNSENSLSPFWYALYAMHSNSSMMSSIKNNVSLYPAIFSTPIETILRVVCLSPSLHCHVIHVTPPPPPTRPTPLTLQIGQNLLQIGP